MGSVPVGVQCPLTSSLGDFPGLSPVLVSITFPFTCHISVFFYSLFFICPWILFVFLLYNRCICTDSVDPSLTHFYVSFQACDWLWYPMFVVPEAEQGCTWSTNLFTNFCPGWDLNLGPCCLMAANVTTRLLRTPALHHGLGTHCALCVTTTFLYT